MIFISLLSISASYHACMFFDLFIPSIDCILVTSLYFYPVLSNLQPPLQTTPSPGHTKSLLQKDFFSLTIVVVLRVDQATSSSAKTHSLLLQGKHMKSQSNSQIHHPRWPYHCGQPLLSWPGHPLSDCNTWYGSKSAWYLVLPGRQCTDLGKLAQFKRKSWWKGEGF